MTNPRRIPTWLAGSTLIAAAMGVMNLGTYGFTLAAARILGPREYGAVAAAMGLMLVLGVLSLGLQASAARRASTAPAGVVAVERDILRAAHRAALALGALTLLAAPLVSAALRLDSWAAAALLGVAVLPLTVMGGYAGLFQGEGRWVALASVYVAVGVGRLGLGVLGMLLREDPLGALVGVAAGNVVPAVLGWWLLRRRRSAEVPEPSGGRVLDEVAHDSHALLAFLAMSNADVILARHVLSDHDSGLYAAGLILAKAVLFLPQFVVVLSFPSMVRQQRTRRQTQALVAVLAIGAMATLGTWLLAPLAVAFVGGSAYQPLEPTVWAFAGIGALLAMMQLLVYGTMARQHRGAVALLWGGLAVLVLITSLTVESLRGLLVTVACVHAAVLAALFVSARMLSARPRASSLPSRPRRPAAR